jgi:ubiquinol-cytochrome c reductase cytochrome c subunit
VRWIAHASVDALPVDLAAPAILAALVISLRGGRGRPGLVAAALALTVAAVPPVHSMAGRSVTGHMVQHLLIVAVAAPCLGIGLARGVGGLRRNHAVRQIVAAVVHPWWSPMVSGGLHLVALVVWHVPAAYDGAVASWPLHSFEHVTFLATGAWSWSSIAHHGHRLTAAGVLGSLLVLATGGAVLGVVLMFAPGPLYAQGGLSDQQVAGALMAGVPALLFGATALVTLARLVDRLGAPTPVRVPNAARRRLPAPAGQAAAPTGARSDAGHIGAVRHLGIVLAVTGGLAGSLVLAREAVGTPGPGGAANVAPVAVPAVEPAQDPDAPSGGDTDLGRDLYRRDCASCHGPEGGGSFRGTTLEGVGGAGVEYVLNTGRMPIGDPDDQIRRSDPAYGRDEIDAIVAYVATLVDGPDVPAVDTAGADLARGGEHYRLQCAACHSATGIGGALTADAYAPSVLPSSPTDVATAVISGPGTMPEFGTAFGDDDLADIAAYVELLQDPPTRGMAIPGGRVGEGLVAWIVGVGALVVALRLMGRRA